MCPPSYSMLPPTSSGFSMWRDSKWTVCLQGAEPFLGLRPIAPPPPFLSWSIYPTLLRGPAFLPVGPAHPPSPPLGRRPCLPPPPPAPRWRPVHFETVSSPTLVTAPFCYGFSHPLGRQILLPSQLCSISCSSRARRVNPAPTQELGAWAERHNRPLELAIWPLPVHSSSFFLGPLSPVPPLLPRWQGE